MYIVVPPRESMARCAHSSHTAGEDSEDGERVEHIPVEERRVVHRHRHDEPAHAAQRVRGTMTEAWAAARTWGRKLDRLPSRCFPKRTPSPARGRRAARARAA